MNQIKWQIPEGLQDTLPGECRRKRQVEALLRRLFALYGYQEIETPLLEYYQALGDETYGFAPQHVWKTFDKRGMVLAIRPDSTIPAVRVAASKLTEEPLPLRLCYMQSAAAFQAEGASPILESTQAGVELMGEGGPQADAEIIALSIEALQAAGLKEFQIDMGQVAFFKGLMAEAGLGEKQAETVRCYVEEKNMLGLQLFLQKCEVSQGVVRRLMLLPQLYGDERVLTQGAELANHAACRAAIRNLKQVLDILKVYGYEKYISIDLGMVHGIHYYSGMIFRGITGRLGQPLLSGGRYDGLPKAFGRDMPATGFALSLRLVLMALERQGETFSPPAVDMKLAFEQSSLAAAIRFAKAQRGAGKSVALAYDATPEELEAQVRRGLCLEAYYVTDGGVRPVGRREGE